MGRGGDTGAKSTAAGAPEQLLELGVNNGGGGGDNDDDEDDDDDNTWWL